MALRTLLFVAFVVLAAGSAAAVWAVNAFIIHSLVEASAASFLLSVSVMLAIIALAVVGLLFLLLSRLIANPLRRLQGVVAAFAVDGTRLPVVVSRLAPKEIRALASGFVDLTAAVESAHGHDADISRMKSDFISTAAHQLRTPLTGIRWALEALEKSGLTPEQQPLVQNAADKSRELVAIIKTLLDISSIESGKFQYAFVPVDLARMAESVTQDLAPLAKERQVSAVFYQGETPVPSVRADEERVRWIVSNLIENAIRYTPAGGSVRVSLESNSGRAFLRVADTGIGIRPEDRANIFERFYRGENARAKENEGNGLGLYIARTIAKDHGGDLDFADNPSGPGTTFTLSLPLAPSQAASAQAFAP